MCFEMKDYVHFYSKVSLLDSLFKTDTHVRAAEFAMVRFEEKHQYFTMVVHNFRNVVNISKH